MSQGGQQTVFQEPTATDKGKDGTVKVTYKPTIEMSSDFLTKSLSRNLFEKHQATLLRLDSYPNYGEFYKKYKFLRLIFSRDISFGVEFSKRYKFWCFVQKI